MAVSKPLLTKFGIHHRLESCLQSSNDMVKCITMSIYLLHSAKVVSRIDKVQTKRYGIPEIWLKTLKLCNPT